MFKNAFSINLLRAISVFLPNWKKQLVKMSLGTPAGPLALISWG